ncbi:unnamed protein product [Peniophora sp. CBMAI 1063]|nr:unnamed protein product [Peniophora sp. CBMAI 1063]
MPSRASSPVPEPSDPKPIRKLQQSLINRIAAGEIIHRPSSALKELIENCLDAGAKSIKVTVKDGGLKLLQIQDDGCGIKKADLPILAQRFTTSKLSKYDDLQRLTTYGFRGEALASISHVAHLTVITKTKKDNCAWRASYSEGVLVAAKTGASAEPKPTAGNDGTTIMVEDLFYNAPQRLSALRASAEEYRHIADVVEKYSIHNASVSFTLKKVGTSSPDVLMPANSTTPQAISSIYGQSVAKSLLNASITAKASNFKKRKRIRRDDEEVEDSEPEREAERPGAWKAEVHFTNANYHAKKTAFLLFINHRLVESPRMKRAIEAVYTGVLPKGTSPFVYLSLELDPATVDPNVHPTKKEVHFLNEEAITERIADEMQALLASVGERTFEYQTLLTGGVAENKNAHSKLYTKGKEKERNSSQDDIQGSDLPKPAPKDRQILSQYKVRTSAADRTLDSMFPAPSRTQSGGGAVPSEPSTPGVRKMWIQESSVRLDQLTSLRRRVIKNRHAQLLEIIQNHTFVSVVDLERELSLIQHSTKLYLVSHGALCEELFYQLGLRQFGNLPRLKLDPPPSLRVLISFAVDAEKGTEASGMSKEEIVDVLEEMVISRRDMLGSFFSVCISEEGLVEAVPLLLPSVLPNLDKLPLFLMRLGPQVEWQDEQNCYDNLLREIAHLYSPGPGILGESGIGEEDVEEREQATAAEKWQIQHTLFPAMRQYLLPPGSLLDRDFVQVANLPDLYHVFERC